MQLVHQLYDNMRYHFGHEEEYMAEVSFEGIDQHKKIHGGIIEEMNKLLNESKDFNILELKLVREEFKEKIDNIPPDEYNYVKHTI